LSKYSTIEPLYFGNTKLFFNYDYYAVYLNGRYWINKITNVELGVSPFYERYKKKDDILINGLPDILFEYFKLQVNSNFNYNSLNYHYEFLDGIKLNLYTETIQVHQEKNASFNMARVDFVYHKRLGKKGNFSFRYQLGIATNKKSPFSPFVLDGFINLRGIGNRVS